jgi:hypothetical protein
LQAAREVEEMLGNHDLARFLGDLVLLRAIERGVEIIGEAARRVSAPYMADHPEIPWRSIIGQRNILAHEYGQIDHELLYWPPHSQPGSRPWPSPPPSSRPTCRSRTWTATTTPTTP